jgi:dihydroorotate dehydrogenase electron transfer subunit
MQTGRGRLTQIRLGPEAGGQTTCPPTLIPAPGQYLLALEDTDQTSPLATPLFPSKYAAGSFLAAPPLPEGWLPGASLVLRGPLGHGFSLPSGTRKVALAALGKTAARLLPLVWEALGHRAAVLLLSDSAPESLPPDVEHMPSSALAEASSWADYLALDVPREALAKVDFRALGSGQALITTPLPCGGMADCGACAVHLRQGFLLACKDGPVVDLKRLRDAGKG